MDYKVKLTDEQRAILEGSKGETLAKVMESLVRYGELFGATEMVPISSKYNHLVTSFGLKALGPVYDLMDKLLEAGMLYSSCLCTAGRRIMKNSWPTSVCSRITLSLARVTWMK